MEFHLGKFILFVPLSSRANIDIQKTNLDDRHEFDEIENEEKTENL